MRALAKRWTVFAPAFTYKPQKLVYRTFLGDDADDSGLNWACIESHSKSGPFALEIWDSADEEWGDCGTFATLKKAKDVGRLLAGIALAKNF